MEKSSAIARLRRSLVESAPRPYAMARALWRYLRPSANPEQRVAQAIAKQYGWRVVAGPFEGTRYPWWAAGSVRTCPKLLGCYESELHPIVSGLLNRKYPLIVNIGSAEGYYVCGLARLMPEAQVYAYEMDPIVRGLCEETVRLNGLADRVVVGPACHIEQLQALPLAGSLIICDVEGYEMELLRPEVVPQLGEADLLVELHDRLDDRMSPSQIRYFESTPFGQRHGRLPDLNTTSTLISRFESTHEIEIIPSTQREPTDEKLASFLPEADRRFAMVEQRWHSNGWMWATTRARRPSVREPESTELSTR